MKKINVRSPFFITVQKEAAKVDPNDDCIRDENGFCIEDDPCIATPTLPQCPEEAVDSVFQDKNLICGATALNIPVSGAVVYNFDIETTGRVNGDYTVSLNNINVPVRIRMDVLANVPKTDLATGTAFENKGLTTHDDTFLDAGYTATGLVSSPTDDLDITKTFAYNSSSHTGNLRFQLHLPVLTNNDMSISVSCPAKATVTTDPVTVGEVTIVSFSSLNLVNPTTSEPFAPLVKLNGNRLGNVEILQKDSAITNEQLFQSNQNTIMGVGRYPQSSQQFSTRRFIQAESNSGAGGTGLTPLLPLTTDGTVPSINNKEFMGNIPNGTAQEQSIRHFSSSLRNTLHSYEGNNFLSDGTNTIEVLLPTGLPNQLPTEILKFMITISKHTVKNYSTASPAGAYISPPLSTNRGTTAGAASALVLQGTMVGRLSKLTFSFEGNNNTALNFDKSKGHICQIENQLIEELDQKGIDTGDFKPLDLLEDPDTTLSLTMPPIQL